MICVRGDGGRVHEVIPPVRRGRGDVLICFTRCGHTVMNAPFHDGVVTCEACKEVREPERAA